MKYWFDAVRTLSYWQYAVFSRAAFATILSAVGSLYLFVELLDTFKIYQKDKYHNYGLVIIFLAAIIYVVATRRPVQRIRYKVPKKDISIEVVIGDLFSIPGETIISSSSTFDTDMASGLISAESLQGQFAIKVFNGQTGELIGRSMPPF